MAEEREANAFDPTIIESGTGSELGQLEKRLVDEAIKQGLITAAQGTMVLETVCAEPKIDAEATVEAMVQRGLITKEAGDSLLEKITDDFIPGYQLGKELGRGAMGVVYEGRQRKLDRRVALKVVNPSLSSDANYVKRFKREALALAKLNHPNIVQVYDYGETEGRIFLALEFVEGEDVSDLMRREGPLAERFAARIVHQAAMGLSHAKQAGIIHRDIKPANLLLTSSTDASAETLSAKVTDLGLAREAKTDQAELTQEGTILGTPAYMAPEQTLGEPADYRSDIYALGATFYHMVTGKLPYQDSSVVNILIKKRTEMLPNPQSIIPDLSDGAVRVMDRMLAREPADRYQDYEQLVKDLALVIAGEQVMTAPVPREQSSLDLDPRSTAARPTTKIVKKEEASSGNPLPALAAVLALGVVILVVVAVGSRSPKPKPTPTSAATTPAAPVAPKGLAEVTKRLDALEAADAQVVLNQLDELRSLKTGIDALPKDAQLEPRTQWQSILARALEKTRDQATKAASEVWQAGQYARLKTLIAEASVPYELLGHDPPERWVELGKKAAAALTQGAGEKERQVWAEAREEWEKPKGERDAMKVIGLLEGFHERFKAFSPVLKQSRKILREAEALTPQLILHAKPPTATIILMGKQVGTGSFEGRVAAGKYLIRATAPGHFELKRTVEVSSRTVETLWLGPKPKVELRHNTELADTRRFYNARNPAKFVTQWSPAGDWSPIRAGFVGVGVPGKRPARVKRDLSTLLSRYRKQNAPGWSVVWWQQLGRPDRGPKTPTPKQLLAAKHEVWFLGGKGHQPILRFAKGWLTLVIRQGESERVLTSRDYRTQENVPGGLRIDFDGKIALVRLDGDVLHSFEVDWPAKDMLEFQVHAGQVSFTNLKSFALRK